MDTSKYYEVAGVNGFSSKGLSDLNDPAVRKEISRRFQMANKRLEKLEKNNLTNFPAYQEWVSYNGGVKFGVRGKTNDQLARELERVNSFLNKKTSLVRETNSILKETAKRTKTDYKSLKELPEKLKGFFEVASKVQQSYNVALSSAEAIGYKKIWQAINEVIESEGLDLQGSEDEINAVIEKTRKLIDKADNEEITIYDGIGWYGKTD